MPGAEEVMETLAKEFIVAVVTNSIEEVQLSRFKGSTIETYIDYLIISETAGYNKPHPGIFDYALAQIDHQDKETILMVGDSLTSDIKGAFL